MHLCVAACIACIDIEETHDSRLEVWGFGLPVLGFGMYVNKIYT